MEKVILKAAKRAGTGKGNSRQLRSGGILPGVLYSGGSSTSIQLQKKEISRLMGSKGKEQALISIELEGDKASTSNHWALIKDYQIDPVKNELLHVDFIEISLKKKIKLTIPIVITKEPIGVKNGGILQQQMREVKVECLPTQIPDGIEVDASSLDIGHSLHVSDLTVKEGVKILSEPQEVILSVIAPAAEEVAPVAPVAEEIKEPELVRKTKTKEEEAEEEPKTQKEQKESKTQKEKS